MPKIGITLSHSQRISQARIYKRPTTLVQVTISCLSFKITLCRSDKMVSNTQSRMLLAFMKACHPPTRLLPIHSCTVSPRQQHLNMHPRATFRKEIPCNQMHITICPLITPSINSRMSLPQKTILHQPRSQIFRVLRP